MAIQNLRSHKYHGILPSGKVNDGGTIGVYVAGSSFATLATIWDTQTKDATLTNPATLDSDGTKEIWFDVTVDIQEKDSSGNITDQSLAIDPNVNTISTGNYNQVTNGSFETGTATVPDNWTLAAETGGTIAIDAASAGQAHGDNGLKFTGTTNGGGTATSDFFPVRASGYYDIVFTVKSTIATVTNSVVINWFQFDDSASSTPTTTAWSETASNPSSFTTYTIRVQASSDAVKAKIVLTGVGSSGTTKVGPTWFDEISVTAHDITSFVDPGYYTDTGAANAYVITPVPAIIAYAAAQRFQFVPANDNTGASTLNVSGLGVKNIKTIDGNNPVAGAIDASGVVEVIYDGTNFVLLSLAISRLVSGTKQATTSGSSINFTSIPSWTKRITISLSKVSTDGTAIKQIQIGDSGGMETTGYDSTFVSLTNAAAVSLGTSTTGFSLQDIGNASDQHSGHAILTLLDPATNLWSFSSVIGDATLARVNHSGGSKTLTGTLDRIRLTTSDTFDNGNINILYEG